MNFRENTSVLALMFVCFAPPADAGTPYEDATAISKSDALDPKYHEWYLHTMRPAFGEVFRPLVNHCLAQVSRDVSTSIGVVLVIDPSGKIKQFFWRDQNSFSDCLEDRLRTATFPAAPKEAFYLGLEAALQISA